MKKKELIKTCEGIFDLFDRDSELTNKLSNITNDPYFNRVSDFLQKHDKLSAGMSRSEENCLKCWNRIVSIAFTHGFVMASMLNPNSKHSLKGIQEIGAGIKKAGLLPLMK